MSDLNLDAVVAPSEDVVAREIDGEIVLVPLVSGIGDADDELYTLNETGHVIWRQLDRQRTLREVAAVLAEEFDASLSDIENDVLGFASELVHRGILVTAEQR